METLLGLCTSFSAGRLARRNWAPRFISEALGACCGKVKGVTNESVGVALGFLRLQKPPAISGVLTYLFAFPGPWV